VSHSQSATGPCHCLHAERTDVNSVMPVCVNVPHHFSPDAALPWHTSFSVGY